MRAADEYPRAAAALWQSAIAPFQRHALHCAHAPGAGGAPCVSWPAFRRALAGPYRTALQRAGGAAAALDPLAPLLVDARCGCVTPARWQQFATYFARPAWPRAAPWPPLDFAFARAALQQPWFHGPATFDETVRALLAAQRMSPALPLPQPLQPLPLSPTSLSSSSMPLFSPPATPSSTTTGGRQTFLVRYSEKCWECNFWTLSFTTSRGVKSVRVAHHRAHEPAVALYVDAADAAPDAVPAAATVATSVSGATAACAQSAGALRLACVPLRCGAAGVDAATGALRTRFATHGAAGARVPVAEDTLVGADFFYILVPRPPGLRTVVYASLAELLACKYSAYIPAPRRHTHTDNPFTFFCPGDSPDCPP